MLTTHYAGISTVLIGHEVKQGLTFITFRDRYFLRGRCLLTSPTAAFTAYADSAQRFIIFHTSSLSTVPVSGSAAAASSTVHQIYL